MPFLASAIIKTPLGKMEAVASEKGIILLHFDDRIRMKEQRTTIERLYKKSIKEGHSDYFEKLQKQLIEYFAGIRKHFTIETEILGTEFQKKAWQALQVVPYGEVRSYSQQALHIGKPKAIRAVGRANAENRLSIVIPCHRLLGKSGNLTGYGGGLWRKQWLLDLEAKYSVQAT